MPDKSDYKEHVVYLLGAGFSAPLGIPVISDFLFRAKDLYFREPEKYKHFIEILHVIGDMHKAKTYFEVDLLNIEEILSILEMKSLVTGQDMRSKFEQFIRDVIVATTPQIPCPSVQVLARGQFQGLPGNFHDVLFGGEIWRLYSHFIGALLRLRLILSEPRPEQYPIQQVLMDQISGIGVDYNVITLNYDEVIEAVWRHLDTYCLDAPNPGAIPKFQLAKLHGTVSGRLTPPTWHKLADSESVHQWSIAHELLGAATAISILGYSLPIADSYIRYLLESAVIDAPNLKRIDVICLDSPDGALRKKYTQFITFKPFRFANADIRDYLSARGLVVSSVPGQRPIHHDFLGLESVHEEFMRTHSG